MATGIAKRKPPARAAEALYLYGITRTGNWRPDPGTASGVDAGGSITVCAVNGLLAWVSRVPRSFADELPQRMQDLQWLAQASVRHQHAVAQIAQHHDILPARFGTVFLSEASLRADIEERKHSVLSVLRRVAGCEEWGVKIFASQTTTGTALAARTGTEYLRTKRRLLSKDRSREFEPEIENLSAKLRKLSKAMAPAGRVSSSQRDLIWQAAFLVPRARRRQFHAVLKNFASECKDKLRLETTGPWPPYSFASSDGD